MLRRAAALILFASTLAWSQAPAGCANLPQTRTNPDNEPKQKIGLKQRLKDQFSGGCANIFLTTCWGDQNQKPPANPPGAPENQDKGQAPPADKPAEGQTTANKNPAQPAPQQTANKDPLAFPEDQSKRAQDQAQGVSSSKQNPNDPLAFPEEQSRRAQDQAQGVSSSTSSSKHGYDARPPGDNSGEMEVIEMKPYDPHKADKDVEVGDFYYKRQNYKAAASRYQEALQLRPGSPSVTFKLADAYEKTKQLDQAAIYYSEYVRQYPKGPQLAHAQAALERLAPVVRADAAQLKQVEIAHDLQAGEQLMAQRKYPDAMQRFCDVSALGPNARALFRLAQSQEASGDFPSAYENFQGYLKLAPDGPFADAARRELARLAPQLQQGQVTSPSEDTHP